MVNMVVQQHLTCSDGGQGGHGGNGGRGGFHGHGDGAGDDVGELVRALPRWQAHVPALLGASSMPG